MSSQKYLNITKDTLVRNYAARHHVSKPEAKRRVDHVIDEITFAMEVYDGTPVRINFPPLGVFVQRTRKAHRVLTKLNAQIPLGAENGVVTHEIPEQWRVGFIPSKRLKGVVKLPNTPEPVSE